MEVREVPDLLNAPEAGAMQQEGGKVQADGSTEFIFFFFCGVWLGLGNIPW